MTFSIECNNFLKSLHLLNHFIQIGANNVLLCPGSRSAPLVLAANEFNKKGLINIYNSIDERSGAFHALGISAASGNITLVITTSGTAVANLLPCAVEADKSNIPLVFITADRPYRLKDCGANQTVNQEEFLQSVCRLNLNSCKNGIHKTHDKDIKNYIYSIYKQYITQPGPCHLNIPFEEPLKISKDNQKKIIEFFLKSQDKKTLELSKKEYLLSNNKESFEVSQILDFKMDGIIIVGPYRGLAKDLNGYNLALQKLQNYTGWPVFADPVSGVSSRLKGVVENWEFIIETKNIPDYFSQILRIGPLSSSKHLENFLNDFKGVQLLIKNKEFRNLDPLKKSYEASIGLVDFVDNIFTEKSNEILSKRKLTKLAEDLISKGTKIKKVIRKNLRYDQKITEIGLANFLPEVWPANYPIMLSASSPIRDWLTFSGNNLFSRRCFSFRGASGIDGTLSSALGIARVINPLLLVTGDLAFLHDINGWLIEKSKELKLIVLIIDNKGGNIFNKLYKDNFKENEIKKLFVMPPDINLEMLAKTHQIPYKNISNFERLQESLNWSISCQKSVIIRAEIDLQYEINLREFVLQEIHANS